MKAIFEAVIRRGGYDLTDIMRRVDEYHIEGKLTDAERDELYALARGDAKPQYDADGEIERLWAAVRALQGQQTGDVREWVQPTGAHDAYGVGDRVLYNGVVYESLRNGNVWSPDVLPDAWTEAAG